MLAQWVRASLTTNSNMNGSSKQHLCKECGAAFTTSRARARHVGHVHGGSRESCPNCNKPFSRKDSLTRHLQTCNSQWICQQCGQEFQSLLHFNRHKVRIHFMSFIHIVVDLAWKHMYSFVLVTWCSTATAHAYCEGLLKALFHRVNFLH